MAFLLRREYFRSRYSPRALEHRCVLLSVRKYKLRVYCIIAVLYARRLFQQTE